jgi:hypothetical protein
MRRETTGFWPRARELGKQTGITLRRVENIVDEGFPDTVWCSDVIPGGLLELKVATARVRMPPQVTFRKGQVPWLMSWAKAGGRCGVLVEFEELIYFVPGSHAQMLAVRGLVEGVWQTRTPEYSANSAAQFRSALHTLGV